VTKKRSVFMCSECGHESPKWLGRCPGCGEWNTFVEERVRPVGDRTPRKRGRAISLSEIESGDTERKATGIAELDRVLGGGVVPGVVALVGGDPGIGKSTLLLQASEKMASEGQTVLYVSAEESDSQVKLRARRLGVGSERIVVLAETDIGHILEEAVLLSPDVVILDSIQAVEDASAAGAPGSVSQVRTCAASLVRFAKESALPVFIVGHVTKQGSIAGPRILEHMVDTVLYFEGDKRFPYRILRAVKNRFGSTDEIGVFEMAENGLVEVTDPSELFVSEGHEPKSGSVVIATAEGTRALLVEVQALTGITNYAVPQRTSTGVDRRRLPIVLAVLERKAGLSLGNRDVFVSVAGGVRVEEPAADLGIALAVASSYWDQPVDARTAFFGEIGLGGELRRVVLGGKRVQEAARLGYRRVVLPAGSLDRTERPEGLEIVTVRSVAQAVDTVLGKRSSRSRSRGPREMEEV